MSEFSKKCEECGKDRVFKNKNSLMCTKSKICTNCSHKKINYNGKNNPFYGKKHSEETKKKMSENHADFTGEKNPFKKWLNSSPENRKKHSDSVKEFWKNTTDEYRKQKGSKLSLSQAKCKYKNANSHKKHISGHYISKSNISYFYRSSWELVILKYLDELLTCGKISNFALEPFCIKYINNGYKYALRVDFYITFNNGIRLLIECKPKGLREYGKNPIKIKAYIEYCKENDIEFLIIGKEEIKTKEIFYAKVIEPYNERII